MLAQILIVLLSLSVTEAYTRVRIHNYCTQQLTIIERDEDDQGSKTQMCKLAPGQYCYKDASLLGAIRGFQNGFNDNATLIDIQFNRESYDYFDIDLYYGFDLPVNVASNKGDSLVCLDKDCPDNTDTSGKIGEVPTDGIFDINYCPSSSGLFEGKVLELVETVHNPKLMKSKGKSLTGRKTFKINN